MGIEGKVLVSACLAGAHCRFDGECRTDPRVVALVRQGKAVPVCPEYLGGLPVPRPPAEIRGGEGREVLEGRARVYDRDGREVTDAFLQGARRTLRLAWEAGCREAIMKDGSPSCGVGYVYDGSFTGTRRPGMGVAAALLVAGGLRVRSVKE